MLCIWHQGFCKGQNHQIQFNNENKLSKRKKMLERRCKTLCDNALLIKKLQLKKDIIL